MYYAIITSTEETTYTRVSLQVHIFSAILFSFDFYFLYHELSSLDAYML